ncbi:NUDIX domain-containing protein [Naasia aerilata]|uniref:DNA mismatch repair protein MutT n=1 Tax=Naasia aerilata TaxID=1162966 RepID=A0ABM8GG59_9MICO|nr:NUDIX domain-containing protein [Naasia aerilata]BDZ47326.1 DNA mismatch repair protein MutT [Naasia aerilata]
MAQPIRRSSGILLFRRTSELEVLLAHMGGPFWQRKDAGAWTIPKGEPEEGEDALQTAEREFREELGLPVPAGPRIDLDEVKQSGGKVVHAWAVEGDLDPEAIVPGTFELEWPPRSGRTATFPEIDRVAWMPPARASELILTAQRAFLSRLQDVLAAE